MPQTNKRHKQTLYVWGALIIHYGSITKQTVKYQFNEENILSNQHSPTHCHTVNLTLSSQMHTLIYSHTINHLHAKGNNHTQVIPFLSVTQSHINFHSVS